MELFIFANSVVFLLSSAFFYDYSVKKLQLVVCHYSRCRNREPISCFRWNGQKNKSLSTFLFFMSSVHMSLLLISVQVSIWTCSNSLFLFSFASCALLLLSMSLCSEEKSNSIKQMHWLIN